jgi:hypothetical protein
MENIIITIADIKKCQIDARSKADIVSPNNCYKYYSLRDQEYNLLLQKKAGRTDLVFDQKGGDLLYGNTVPEKQPKVYRKVESPEGFTPEEYTSLFKRRLPNHGGDMQIRNDDNTGKVHAYEQNGNVSIMMGAPVFSEKYKHLITSGTTECPEITVTII